MPSLRDYFNLKACPRVVFGTSYFKELCLSATQTTGLCRADRGALGSAALLQLRALDHQDTSPYRAYKSESYRTQRLQKTVPHFHHSPWETPHVHFQEERYSSQCLTSPYSPVQGVKHTKNQQKSVQILGGSLSFQLWLRLFLWAVSTAPKQHFKRFHPGVEIELLWETYQIRS